MQFYYAKVMKRIGWLGERRSLKPFLHILMGWVLSTIIMCIVYPELLINHQISLIRFQDLECDHMAFFTFLSNLFHGGVQLWNPYDQAPLMLHYMAGGLLDVSHIFGALVYPIVNLFYDSAGEAFHVTASVVPFLFSNLLVIIGTYLLASRFSSRLIVLLLCMTIAGSLLSASIYFGVNGRHLVYFYPLVIHFILRFFEKFRLTDALLAIIIMVVCVVSSPFIGSGYFYQGVHFFILCVLVWSIVRQDLPLYKVFNSKTWRFNRSIFLKIGITVIFIIVVLAPIFILMLENYNDYWFGSEIARVQNKFSVTEYFNRPGWFAPKKDILVSALDWSKGMLWWKSWQWLGFSTIFLSICGLILNRDRRKYIFFGTIVLLWLLNGPRLPSNMLDFPTFLVHVINALTNPGKFLTRSFHEPAAFSIPYYLIPLIAMGLESLFSIAERCRSTVIVDDGKQRMVHVNSWTFKYVSGLLAYRVTVVAATGSLLFLLLKLLNHKSVHPVFFGRYSDRLMTSIIITSLCLLLAPLLLIFSKKIYGFISDCFRFVANLKATISGRLQIVGVVTFAMVTIVSIFVPKFVTLYLLISCFISFIVLFLLLRVYAFSHRLPLLALLLLTLFAIDAACLRKWIEKPSSRIMVEKLMVPGLERLGKVELDFQNPVVLPLREYYNSDTVGQIPHYVTVNSINQQGVFYRYTNLGKWKNPATMMSESRHVSFVPILEKNSFKVYLQNDQRMFFQAQLAVKDGPGVFDDILRQSLDRTIIVIDHDSPEQGPYARSLPVPLPKPKNLTERKFHKVNMLLREADTTNEGKLDLYWFDLPEGFPKYLTTCIFTRDRNLVRVNLNGKEFVPAQGRLVSPFTFDVQNIVSGKLGIALPRGYRWHGSESIAFTYPMEGEIGMTNIHRYEADTLEFDYVAEEDGWLVIHYPFDKKWRITIDGVARKVYKANYCFMTVPVREGNQRILIQYWPDTNLRFFIGLSYIVNLIALLIVSLIGIRSVTKNVNMPNEGGQVF
jgi:hypothetical protein